MRVIWIIRITLHSPNTTYNLLHTWIHFYTLFYRLSTQIHRIERIKAYSAEYMTHISCLLLKVTTCCYTYWRQFLIQTQGLSQCLHEWPRPVLYVYVAWQNQRLKTQECKVTMVCRRPNGLRWRAYLTGPREWLFSARRGLHKNDVLPLE